MDNHLGATLALDHLYKLGHRRIAYIGHQPDRYSMRIRYDTFHQWIAEHGLPVDTNFLVAEPSMSSEDTRVTHIRALLQQAKGPSAIFAATDDLAAEVLAVARACDIAVPGQLSVVGFDDTLLASLTTPSLTTIGIPLKEMGERAAQLLLDKIEGRKSQNDLANAATQREVLTPELIVQASSGSGFARVCVNVGQCTGTLSSNLISS